MRIWVVRTGEPVPRAAAHVRLARSGMIAARLAARGHDVTWWTATYEHGSKRHVLAHGDRYQVRPGLVVRALWAPGYRKHQSIMRLVHHWWLGRALARAFTGEVPPDLILSSLPTTEFASVCTAYGRRHGVPVVLDCRDMWPDIFIEHAPKGLKWLARVLLTPMERQARRACRDATAIMGHTPAYVAWGLGKGGRVQSQWDASFPLAYSAEPPGPAEAAEAMEWWESRGVRKEAGGVIACFVGTLTRHFEVATLADAVRDLRAHGDRIRVVVCGAGDLEGPLRSAMADDGRLVMAGWVDAPKIWTLLQMSDVGLAPYRSSASFRQSVPNKPIEYLSAGLPVISSLQGALAELLAETGAGTTYPNDSPSTLAAELRSLAADPERLDRMRAAARRLFAERFSADVVYVRLCEHLESITADRRKAT